MSIYNGTTLYNITLDEYYKILQQYEQKKPCETCNSFIYDVFVEYGKSYHVYVALFVCCFGSIANILNIIVLTRKDMACAPINRILTALAVTDLLIMVEYIPFSYYYYIELPGKMNFPYVGAIFMLFHTHVTQTLHTTSICLTLTLAIWRYLAIGYPDSNHLLCSEHRCKLAIFLSLFLPIILCCPTYLTFKIAATEIEEDKTYILYHLHLSEIAKRNDYILINFWLYAVIIKLIPCVLLTVISLWLIKTLFTAKKRKRILREYNEEGAARASKSKAERRADRTTKMLVAVLVLFLTTEFPQGIFALVIGMKGQCIFLQCYQKLGEVMDILALLNGSINFILYCWMNHMFRLTFRQLFQYNLLSKWSTSPTSDGYKTTGKVPEMSDGSRSESFPMKKILSPDVTPMR